MKKLALIIALLLMPAQSMADEVFGRQIILKRSDCSTITQNGLGCWDTDGFTLCFGNGTTCSLSISNITVADAASDTTTFPMLSPDATGSIAPKTDAGISYNAATNSLTTGSLFTNGSNITYTVAASGADYTDIQTALDALPDTLHDNRTATISVGDGTYAIGSPISYISPFSKYVTIKGQNTYSKTFSSVQSSSGSAGAWSIILNVNSVTNITANDYITITDAANGTLPTYLDGVFKVTNVDSGNTRITISSAHQNATAPSGAVSGTFTVLKTILSFTGTDGLRLWDQTAINLKDLVFVGTSTGNGLSIQDVSRLFTSGVVATSGFDIGVYANYNSEINHSGSLVASGATSYGFYVSTSASFDNSFTTSGNGLYGLYVNGGVVNSDSGSVSTGNANNGIYVAGGGIFKPVVTSSTGNTGYGFRVDPQSYMTLSDGVNTIGSTNSLGTYKTFLQADSSGNFGFGTETPGQVVHVNGAIRFGGTTVGDYADLNVASGVTTLSNSNPGDHPNQINFYLPAWTGTTDYYDFYSDSGSTFRIMNLGNIGVKTTAPDKALEINSATGENLRMTYNDSNGSAANYTDVSLSSSGDLTIDSSGDDVFLDPISIGSTTGVKLSAASGVLTVAGIGNTNNENLTFNFESISNTVTISSTTGASPVAFISAVRLNDDNGLLFGISNDARFEWDTSETNDTLKLTTAVGSSAQSGNIIICETADKDTNFGVPTVSNPTLRIQSADATTTDDYIQLYHDQSRARIQSGDGLIGIGGIDKTNNEDLLWDFETTSNTVAVTSGTGVTTLAINGIAQTTDGNIQTSSKTTDAGWTVVTGASTACNTTCTSACVVGFDTGTVGVALAHIVACTDASADECLCAGAS